MITKMLQRCYKDVTKMLQRCYKDVASNDYKEQMTIQSWDKLLKHNVNVRGIQYGFFYQILGFFNNFFLWIFDFVKKTKHALGTVGLLKLVIYS